MVFFTKTQTPCHGDTRIIKRFAWAPTRIGDIRIWLETYKIKQKYHSGYADSAWHDIDYIIRDKKIFGDLV